MKTREGEDGTMVKRELIQKYENFVTISMILSFYFLRFFRYLRNVSIESETNIKPNVEFTADGDLKSAELKIMNLRPSVTSKGIVWEEIGVWKSWQTNAQQRLDIRDIYWPGNSHAPPQGVPEKFHLKITFLEEAPYINLSPADPISGKCLMDRGVLCRVAADNDIGDIEQAHKNGSFYQCCSGFCIDLLEKFAEQLGFTYELVRVEDGRWGTLDNGKWNGLSSRRPSHRRSRPAEIPACPACPSTSS